MSVTCEVSAGAVLWWVTRESGMVPPGCGDLQCGVCGASGGSRVRTRGYVVVKAVGPGGCDAVAIGLLCPLTLGVVAGRFVEDVRRLFFGSESRWAARSAELFLLAEQGLYSHRLQSWCGTEDRECARCDCGCVAQGRLLWRDRYAGVFPCRDASWWSGVTDAAGMVGGGDLPWLMCWESVG